MEFLSLSRRRSSARNVPSGEERGETDVFAGYKQVCHWCFYHISHPLWSWTKQHGIYLFYTMTRKEKRPIHISASYRLTFRRSVLVFAFFPNIFRFCFFFSLSYLATYGFFETFFNVFFCSKQNNGENILQNSESHTKATVVKISFKFRHS